MSIIQADNFIITKARPMRKEMTKYEKMLWFKISNKQLGVKFRKQVPLLNIYIADFLCF
jgi:cyclase